MGLTELIKEKWSRPTEPNQSFEGRTVLITGANTGLGLEAAKKIAALNADKLIITTRSSSKGNAAKDQIKQWLSQTKSSQRTQIIPLELDMSSADAVRSFIQRLQSTTDRLDAAILNAGINASRYLKSTDGFEETIQVNAVSTVFLATLLIPILVSTAKSSKAPTHLTFVSSRTSANASAFPDSESVLQSSSPLQAMSDESSFPVGAMGGQVQYGRSKLMLEYAMRRMALASCLRDEVGKPYVIVNSVCPGATKTDLARSYDSWILKLAVSLWFILVSKSVSDGATIYLQALALDEASMGQLWAPGQLVEEWDAITGEKGRNFGDTVWEELKKKIIQWDGSVRKVLSTESKA